MLVGFVYPFFEGIAWNEHFGFQAWLKATFGAEFHDFAGSVVVHAFGGWVALVAVLLLGARRGRYSKEGGIAAHPPSSIPFLALGAWVLSVGWFGFNVMSAQTHRQDLGTRRDQFADGDGGRHASPRSWSGATIRASCTTVRWRASSRSARAPTSCIRSARWSPARVAGALFVVLFTLTQNRWKIDDVLGVWPLHGVCGAWGGIAAGIFGAKALGGLGGVAFGAQVAGTLLGIADRRGRRISRLWALKATVGLRLDAEEEFNGADLTIHKISSTPDQEVRW